MSALTKNQNAVKPEGETATSFLYIRAHGEDKGCWNMMAREAELDLSKWVVQSLNAKVPPRVRGTVRRRWQEKRK